MGGTQMLPVSTGVVLPMLTEQLKDDEALAFDVCRLDADGFVQAQSALIDQCAVGAKTDFAEGAQEAVDFQAGEHFGQGLITLDVDLLPDVPGDAEVIAVEGPQSADRLINGAGPKLPLILEVDQEVEDPLGSQLRKIGLRVVVGELVDPAVVGLTTALSEPFELDKTGEVLIPLG